MLNKQLAAAAVRAALGQQKQANRQYEDDVTMTAMKLSNRESSFARRPDSADDVTGDSVRTRYVASIYLYEMCLLPRYSWRCATDKSNNSDIARITIVSAERSNRAAA